MTWLKTYWIRVLLILFIGAFFGGALLSFPGRFFNWAKKSVGSFGNAAENAALP